MSDAAFPGFFAGGSSQVQLHFPPPPPLPPPPLQHLSHPPPPLPLPHAHAHPAASELSLSTPVHSLEECFFDDGGTELGLAGVWMPAEGSAGAGGAGGGGGATAGTGGEPGIPFVQIHTTDLQQPAEKSYRSRATFRRRTACEIKSEAELIKSELAEAAAKERLNATPTPPARNSSCPSAEGKVQVVPVELPDELPPALPSSSLLRCPNCPFLTLCQVRLQQHLHCGDCFGPGERLRRECPGCPNIFYSSEALGLHLCQDHRMEEGEVLALLGDPAPGKGENLVQENIQTPSQPKSRIFIKSVACLREPQQDFAPLMPDSGSAGNILDLLEGVAECEPPSNQATPPALAPPLPLPLALPAAKPSQKISIKSVDVLREPALLPFDFQLPSSAPNHPLITDNSLLEVPVMDKARQPKIYVRKPVVPPAALNAMGFNGLPAMMEAGESGLPEPDVFQADTLLTPTCPLPGFEPSLAPLAPMCTETFPFDSVLNGNVGAAAGLENTRFSALDLDFGVDFVADAGQQQQQPQPPPINAASILSELEQHPVQLEHYLPPTAPSAPKQKIFIKNVDILKAPQRGTLHLRTVDELNLMNRNEVERLIVPNLEPMTMSMMELPPVAQPLELGTRMEVQTQTHPHPHPQSLTDFQPSINGASSWPSEDGYDLADDLGCWPWMEEALPETDVALAAPSEVADAPHSEGLGQAAGDLLVKDFPQLYPSPPEEIPIAAEGEAGEAEVPPLVPVKATGGSTNVVVPPSATLSSLPVPPLVPLVADAESSADKPGRIYVANNLLPAAVEPSLAGGTSVRGRPYGAKHSGGTAAKRRPPQGGTGQVPEGGKCQVEGCMFRFKSPATLEYHGKCHNGALSSGQPMICPECKSTEFSNWNCLHTHLWRTHQIDMELYCCQLCSFKTPIYSRLVNTHAKIHSEERNYKCEQCGKGFKNTKQLKNHRRLHRTQGLGMGKQVQSQAQAQQETPAEGGAATALHRCEDCGAAFKQRKTLREHLCKERNEQLECPECQRVFGSKSSLRLHLRSHQEHKRFRCEACDYEASDHNAFRRHLATHKERKRYVCPHCDFRAIQSTAFRHHLQKRHPEQELSSIIYNCNSCSFSSINQGLLLVHQAKHEASGSSHKPAAAPAATSSQIKVETSLVLAHSSTNASVERPAVSLTHVDGLRAS